MSKAQLTVNIAHPDSKGIHQETLQWEFDVREDGNWLQSFMDYVNQEEEKDHEEIKPKIVT